MQQALHRQPCGISGRPGHRLPSLRRHVPFSGRCVLLRRAATNSEVDIETQVELFMKRQAEIESGAAFARTRNPEAIIGGDVVSEEAAQQYCREIFEVLKVLKGSRDMSLNEVKLIVQIEDPRARERRAQGIEDDRGVSRDEMAAALVEVSEGRVPKDRIALKCLHEDMVNWPFLDVVDAAKVSVGGKASTPLQAVRPAVSPSDYAAVTGGDSVAKPYVMGEAARKGDKPQGLADMLPDWVGFGVLYGVSAIPVLLVIATVSVLFWNSLK